MRHVDEAHIRQQVDSMKVDTFKCQNNQSRVSMDNVEALREYTRFSSGPKKPSKL